MGCNMGCMTKAKKVFMNRQKNSLMITSDFKFLLFIVDYLPLNSLIKVSKVSR